MFAELMPLLRKRGLIFTISLVEGDTLRATVLPQKASERDARLGRLSVDSDPRRGP